MPWKERKPLDEKRSFIAEWERQEESLAELCRRYEISRGLLWNWRSLVRRGDLRPEPQAVFVPLQVISEPSTAARPRRVEPPPTGPDAAGADSRIEITLPDGTSIRIGHDVSLAALRRVVTVLRR